MADNKLETGGHRLPAGTEIHTRPVEVVDGYGRHIGTGTETTVSHSGGDVSVNGIYNVPEGHQPAHGCPAGVKAPGCRQH